MIKALNQDCGNFQFTSYNFLFTSYTKLKPVTHISGVNWEWSKECPRYTFTVKIIRETIPRQMYCTQYIFEEETVHNIYLKKKLYTIYIYVKKKLYTIYM